MAGKNEPGNTNTGKDLILERRFDASAQIVFKAWTDGKQLAEWWGPKDFTSPVCEIDVMPGGEINIDMKGPDGKLYPVSGVFHEIIDAEKLVFTTAAFKDTDGNWQLEIMNTVEFADEDGNTKLTLHASVLKQNGEVKSSVDGMQKEWNESLDRLAALITKEK